MLLMDILGEYLDQLLSVHILVTILTGIFSLLALSAKLSRCNTLLAAFQCPQEKEGLPGADPEILEKGFTV